jgi:hypothetical protein
MALGVLTEKGILMTSAPVLTDYETSMFFFRKSCMNKKINELVKNSNKLKQFDQLKGRKAAKSN